MSRTPAHRKLIAKSISKSAKKVIIESGINASTRSGNKALDHLAKRLAEQPFNSLTAAVKVGEELGQRIVALSQELDRQSLDQGVIRQLVFQKQLPTADLSIADPKPIAVQPQPSQQPAALTTDPEIEPEEEAADLAHPQLVHPEIAAVEELAGETASASEWVEDEAAQEILIIGNSADDDEPDDELDENPEDDELDDDELEDDELDENPEASQSLASPAIDETAEQDVSVAESIEQAEDEAVEEAVTVDAAQVTSEMTLKMDNENEAAGDELGDPSVDEIENADLKIISESAADIDDEQEVLSAKV